VLTHPVDWSIITVEEASLMLFTRCADLMLKGNGYMVSADVTIRILTQRLYGDYRQIGQTQEYKRAERHVTHFKTTGLGKALF
jgi:hypothetical protein